MECAKDAYAWAAEVLSQVDYNDETMVDGLSAIMYGGSNEAASAVCDFFGVDLVNPRNDTDILRLAAVTLLLSESFEMFGIPIPVYFGSHQAGLLIQYVEPGIFGLLGFIDEAPNKEMGMMLTTKLRISLEHGEIIDGLSILTLCYFYLQVYDMSLAISDWIFFVEQDSDGLVDFSITQFDLPTNNNHQIFSLLAEMVGDGRCDAIAFNAINAGLQKKEQEW